MSVDLEITVTVRRVNDVLAGMLIDSLDRRRAVFLEDLEPRAADSLGHVALVGVIGRTFVLDDRKGSRTSACGSGGFDLRFLLDPLCRFCIGNVSAVAGCHRSAFSSQYLGSVGDRDRCLVGKSEVGDVTTYVPSHSRRGLCLDGIIIDSEMLELIGKCDIAAGIGHLLAFRVGDDLEGHPVEAFFVLSRSASDFFVRIAELDLGFRLGGLIAPDRCVFDQKFAVVQRRILKAFQSSLVLHLKEIGELIEVVIASVFLLRNLVLFDREIQAVSGLRHRNGAAAFLAAPVIRVIRSPELCLKVASPRVLCDKPEMLCVKDICDVERTAGNAAQANRVFIAGQRAGIYFPVAGRLHFLLNAADYGKVRSIGSYRGLVICKIDMVFVIFLGHFGEPCRIVLRSECDRNGSGISAFVSQKSLLRLGAVLVEADRQLAVRFVIRTVIGFLTGQPIDRQRAVNKRISECLVVIPYIGQRIRHSGLAGQSLGRHCQCDRPAGLIVSFIRHFLFDFELVGFACADRGISASADSAALIASLFAQVRSIAQGRVVEQCGIIGNGLIREHIGTGLRIRDRVGPAVHSVRRDCLCSGRAALGSNGDRYITLYGGGGIRTHAVRDGPSAEGIVHILIEGNCPLCQNSAVPLVHRLSCRLGHGGPLDLSLQV